MNCTTCASALQLAPSGTVGLCSTCQQYFGLQNGAAIAIAKTVPWPTRTRDQEEDAAAGRAFDAAANAPNPTSNILKMAIPAVIVVVMIVVGLSIFMSAQSSTSAPAPGAAPPPPKTPAAAPPPAAKKK